jgi:hypothetical protein
MVTLSLPSITTTRRAIGCPMPPAEEGAAAGEAPELAAELLAPADEPLPWPLPVEVLPPRVGAGGELSEGPGSGAGSLCSEVDNATMAAG